MRVGWIDDDYRKCAQTSQTSDHCGHRVYSVTRRCGAAGVTWTGVPRHSGRVGHPRHRVCLGQTMVATHQVFGERKGGKLVAENAAEPNPGRQRLRRHCAGLGWLLDGVSTPRRANLESLGHELNLTDPPVGAGAERPQLTLTKDSAAAWRYPGAHGARDGASASSIASM